MVAPALLGVPKLRSVNVFFFFFVCLVGCPLRPFCVFFFFLVAFFFSSAFDFATCVRYGVCVCVCACCRAYNFFLSFWALACGFDHTTVPTGGRLLRRSHLFVVPLLSRCDTRLSPRLALHLHLPSPNSAFSALN
eukprot:NODE_6056_length_473_cov_28.966981_g4564_i0.p1 GENE.NODE_6056_length_473_cov_28.966981_g4564_i0~~NODE_6056_length_473_cov_28.966981_g4564_i0.p1  ORF type:complete len:157 (+),score=26.44 NODE_6056_length_473_cov_28.966981_g4564_i0:67-471(+)